MYYFITINDNYIIIKMPIKFSLCIPTMDRFDDFLDQYLELYLEFKDIGILDEIIISDDGDQDYEKILQKYNRGISKVEPIRIYKNPTRLGVLKNKAHVASLAKKTNFIALIDSDNFVPESYFKEASRIILEKGITPDMPCSLIPIFAQPNYHFAFYKNFVFDQQTAANYCKLKIFGTMINSGNFIITPVVYDMIKFDDNVEIKSYDAVYLHLVALEQISEYRIYVTNMEYLHVVHPDSNFLKNKEANGDFYNNTIVPRFMKFIGKR